MGWGVLQGEGLRVTPGPRTGVWGLGPSVGQAPTKWVATPASTSGCMSRESRLGLWDPGRPALAPQPSTLSPGTAPVGTCPPALCV